MIWSTFLLFLCFHSTPESCHTATEYNYIDLTLNFLQIHVNWINISILISIIFHYLLYLQMVYLFASRLFRVNNGAKKMCKIHIKSFSSWLLPFSGLACNFTASFLHEFSKISARDCVYFSSINLLEWNLLLSADIKAIILPECIHTCFLFAQGWDLILLLWTDQLWKPNGDGWEIWGRQDSER